MPYVVNIEPGKLFDFLISYDPEMLNINLRDLLNITILILMDNAPYPAQYAVLPGLGDRANRPHIRLFLAEICVIVKS